MEVVREHLSKENEVGLICYTNKEIDVEANLSFTSSPDLKVMISSSELQCCNSC